MRACLADATIAELLDGALSGDARAELHAHIDQCDACRALVAAAVGDGPPVAPGTTLGRYVVVDVVGAGAMGVVYDAWDPTLRRRVALKLLRTDRDDDGTPRLLREAQAMARLQHPNVVAVHDVGELDRRVFVAMELVDGDTLRGWLAAARRPWRDVLALFLQIGEGLAAAHAVGLVHRDFKPDNVLVGDARARVTDFGLAHARTVEPAPASHAVGELTATGALLGTPAYMAPEQLRGGAVDARTDEFAFCVALHEALYGARPFTGADLAELRAAIEAGPPTTTSAVPARVRRVVQRGLAADPAQRYPTMRALLDDLTRARRPRRAPLVGAALAIAAIAGGFAVTRAPGDPCRGIDAAWGDAWDAAGRMAVAAAFAKRGGGADAADRVDRALTAYRGAWLATSRQVCEARTHGTVPDAVAAARAQCLDDRRRDAAALARVLAAADTTAVERADKALDALEPVELCAAARAHELAPASDPLAEALRSRLADAKAEEAAGHYALALAIARDAAAEAHARADHAIEAALVFRRGHIEHNAHTGDPEASMHAAARAAVASHDDGSAADAWTYLSYLAGFHAGRRAEGERWSSYAAAAIERLGGDELREAHRLHYLFGLVESDLRRTGEAAALLDRAREVIVRAGAPEALVLENDQDRGAFALERGHYADAYAVYHRIRERQERQVGPTHPGLSFVLDNEAVSLVLLGRAAEAVPLYERVLALHGAGDDAFTRFGLARAYRRLARFTDALDQDRRSVALYDAESPPRAWIGEALTGEGEDLLALGRAAEAIAPLERALDLRSRPDADADERAQTAFVLARALWDGGGDRARAAELAAVARDETAPLAAQFGSEYATRLDELDRWRASHPAAPARGAATPN